QHDIIPVTDEEETLILEEERTAVARVDRDRDTEKEETSRIS
ncbi:hypothetical protein Tco_0844487, partial [Tanacetum coccineum]